MSKLSLKFVALVVAMFTMQAMGVGSTLSAKVVTGKVVSAMDSEPLIGATVQVDGASTGTITDFEGNFKIEAKEGQTLVVSYVGYIAKKVQVGAASNYNIALEENRASLDEVVVIGYGVQKKKW